MSTEQPNVRQVVQFFGRFLVGVGEVQQAQVDEGLAWCRQHNRNIGTLAISRGYMTLAQTEAVHKLQRTRDGLFGELAVSQGMLTEDQVAELLDIQSRERLMLGEALVRLGHLSSKRRTVLLRAYELQRGRAGDFSTDETDPFRKLIQTVYPRWCYRVSGVRTKMGAAHVAPTEDYFAGASLIVNVPQPVAIALRVDSDYAYDVLSGFLGLEVEEIDRAMIWDGLCEYLNIFAEALVGQITPTPVCSHAQFSGGPAEGLQLPFESPVGTGCITIARARLI